MKLQPLLQELRRFPWRTTAYTLRHRFREDRLGLTASSLTFTTTIALVPFFTVLLAVFTAFPMFAQLQVVLQKWLVESLIPDHIARQVLGYLTQFASKASKLGVAGVAILIVTAVSLVFTIDRTLNNLWRVRAPRPLAQRLLVYWAAMTLGPLLLGASLTMTSYLLSASRGLVSGLPGGVTFLFDAMEFFLLAGAMAATFHYIPNTQVKWSHAWTGGLFVSAGIEAAKKVLGLYIVKVPTYSMVYGAFATVPILLVWIYVSWVIVLLGAVIAAYLPSLLAGVERRGGTPGWEFTLAIESLGLLAQPTATGHRGLSAQALAETLRVDPVQLESVLGTLLALDWVGRMDETEGRYVLLVDLAVTPATALAEKLLLQGATGHPLMNQNAALSLLVGRGQL